MSSLMLSAFRRCAGSALTVLSLATALPVLAQTGIAALTGAIEEEYSGQVLASSVRSVVGLVLGDVPTPLDFSQLGAVLPKGLEASGVCFFATTNDGIYSAVGSLAVPAGASGRLPIRAKAFSKFSKQLSKYPAGTFTGRLTSGPNCLDSDKSTVLFPLSFGAAGGARPLRVAVNGSGALKVSATLRGASANPAWTLGGACTPMGDRSVAFDHLCQFGLPADLASGMLELVIEKTPRAGPRRSESYNVRLGS